MTGRNNNTNRGRPPHSHNTRFRASLTSQNPGDCPTAVEDAIPSPIRRVAQVQQQVEQVIQQELDSFHVFNDISPPTGQDSHGVLPNSFATRGVRTSTQEGENAPSLQDVPIAQVRPREHRGDDDTIDDSAPLIAKPDANAHSCNRATHAPFDSLSRL